MESPQTPPSPPPFLDVPALLETSQPQPRVNWVVYSIAMVIALGVIALFGSSQTPEFRQSIQAMSLMALLILMGAMMLTTLFNVRRHRARQAAVDAIEELIQLRRWDQAAVAVNLFLSEPAHSARQRTQALIYLSSLLARYHRFADAITVQNYLLEDDYLDDGTSYGLRLGRAMAMLHEDHLLDADRAISDLRRRSRDQSGGLALVEIYRDVKTGHPAEAIQIFADKLSLIRRQLGHRVADAHALVARAYDLLGREDEARAAYERATLLSPVAELHRRYPEVARLSGKYPAAHAPAEAM